MRTDQLQSRNPLLTPDNSHNDRWFLSCDWGTTSFRLNLIDKDSGNTVAKISDSNGIKKIYTQWSGQQNRVARSDHLLSFIRKKIISLQDTLHQNLSGLPVVVSGMASSSIGIKELPYRRLPLNLMDPDLNVETFSVTEDFPYKLYLVSGICTDVDVMRGEETQLLGLAETHDMPNGIYILPGTHSKHVYVKHHQVTNFKTYLTGELFELLSTHSILADSLSKTGKLSDLEQFKAGIQASLEEDLLHSLFQIRARDLLDQIDKSAGYDFLSGLLIGAEMTGLKEVKPERIILSGNEQLLEYYASACEYLNLNYLVSDSTDSTTTGHSKILNKIRTQS